jgi:hypothetical protein
MNDVKGRVREAVLEAKIRGRCQIEVLLTPLMTPTVDSLSSIGEDDSNLDAQPVRIVTPTACDGNITKA